MTEPGRGPRDAGISLVEVLVGMGLFGVLGSLLLGLALSTSRVTEDTRALTNVNEESRLGMERLVRELRQADVIEAVHFPTDAHDTTALTFWTDFDGDDVRETNAADPEVLTYRWDPDARLLTLTANDASGTAQTRPVLAVTVSDFTLGLFSSKWQYDGSIPAQPADGRTTWQELDAAGLPIGNGNLLADNPELTSIDLVEVSMTVLDGARAQTYTTKVDLRNRS